MLPSAGIVLAGGRSSRMGVSKARLEWHGSTLLRRVSGIVARAAGGLLVVVRAPGQELPALPGSVEVVDDPREGLGPVQGIAAGLEALQGRAEVAYVSSTDVPLLHPAFVRRVLEAVEGDVEAAVPHVDGFRQPLSAAYRTSLLPQVEALIEEGLMKPAFLLGRCRVRWLDEQWLLGDRDVAAADPHLESLCNLNEPEEYVAARAEPAPATRVERLGALRPAGANGAIVETAAATLGAAAASAGVALDRHVVAVVNGDRIAADPEYPLAAGDVVRFRRAS